MQPVPNVHQVKTAQGASRRALDILIVGHVTRDLLAGRSILGGTAAFSARAASCMGLRSAVVTSAPENFSLLEPLRRDPLIELVKIPSPNETVFHLDYTPQGRLLRVPQRAQDIRLDDVPHYLRRAPLTYVAPILGECGPELISGLNSRVVLLSLQGALRKLGPHGEVLPTQTALALRPPQNLTAVVFSELDHPQSERLSLHLAQQGVIVALTRSIRGVSLYLPERVDVPAVPAREVDPTGAGDVFGLIFGLGLSAGLDPVEAARKAVVGAASVVEGPGLGNLEHTMHELDLSEQASATG